MALGRRWQGFFPPLSHSLPVAEGLLASVLLALLAGPIPLGRLSPRPKTGCIRAGFATVPGKGVRRRKPLLASLQQANPRAAMDRSLRWYRTAIMLDHGPRNANFRGPSPSSGASTPRQGVLGYSLPACPTSVQRNHPAATCPIIVGITCRPVARPRFAATAPYLSWPPHPVKTAPNLTAAGACGQNAAETFRGASHCLAQAGFEASAMGPDPVSSAKPSATSEFSSVDIYKGAHAWLAHLPRR